MGAPIGQTYQNCIAVCTTSSDFRVGYTATAPCSTIKELLSNMGNERIEYFSFTTAGKTQAFKNIAANQAATYLACAIKSLDTNERK